MPTAETTIESADTSVLTKAVRALLIVTLVVVSAYFVVVSIHWPLALDSPIMHYVNFLMRHGFRPYVDITDNNMPGAYYTEGLAMRVFGGSDLAWRVYDFFLLAVMTCGLMLIAKPYDWLAGLFAGCVFIAFHGPEGPPFAVEREQVITVLLVLGYVALFYAVRRSRPWWMLLFGLANGVAASIKPTFLPFGFVMLAIACGALSRRRELKWTYVACGLAGIFAVLAFDIAFVLHYGAVDGFRFIVREVLPRYGSFVRAPFNHLVRAFDHEFMLLAAAGLVLAVANRRRFGKWTWEQWAIAAGVAFALLSYFVQGKGFPHHKYTIIVLTLLLVGIEVCQALRSLAWPRSVAIGVCAFVALWLVPQKIVAMHHVRPHSPLTDQLEADMTTLGGTAQLQRKVECLDLVYGCLNALYHLQIVGNTGYTGDLLLFSDSRNPVTQYYRQRWWKLQHDDPASVLVISNEWFERDNSYSKLDQWPEFVAWLRANYTLAVERRFNQRLGAELAPGSKDSNERDSYRIYVRNGSSEAARASVFPRP